MQPPFHHRAPRRAVFTALVALAGLAASGPAHAGPLEMPSPKSQNPAVAQPAGPQQQSQSLRARAQELAMKLARIRQKTIAGDEKLQKRHQQFASHLTEAMKENGHTPEADYGRLSEIRRKLQNPEQQDGDRTQLLREFQKLRAGLQQAQREAMQDDALRRERQSLAEDTVLAMKEQNPRTDALLQEFQSVRQQLQRASRTGG